MITSKDLRKAPFKTTWIMQKENMKVTSYNGIPCILWNKKNNMYLWSYNHQLYCIREETIFDMDGTLCGWVVDRDVYGPKFGTLPNIMSSALFYF